MKRLMTQTPRSYRRALAVGLTAISLGLMSSACQTVTSASHLGAVAHSRRVHLPLIVVLAPDANQVVPLVNTLRSELAADFDVQAIAVSQETSTADLAHALATLKPKAAVLVDNSVVQLYAPIALAAEHPLPSVIVMASFVERLQKLVPNSTAISFETPAVTTLSAVRSVLSRPITRAGVIYREGFETFITQERARATQEGIELVAVPVSAHPNVATLSRALRRLEREHLDAVWVSNDNVLLSKRLLGNAWFPFAKKSALPIVVGVPALVRSTIPFGTYAAVPDIVGLGVQTADLIYALQPGGWGKQMPRVQPPVAVKTYLNVAQARLMGASDETEKQVDVLLRHGGS